MFRQKKRRGDRLPSSLLAAESIQKESRQQRRLALYHLSPFIHSFIHSCTFRQTAETESCGQAGRPSVPTHLLIHSVIHSSKHLTLRGIRPSNEILQGNFVADMICLHGERGEGRLLFCPFVMKHKKLFPLSILLTAAASQKKTRKKHAEALADLQRERSEKKNCVRRKVEGKKGTKRNKRFNFLSARSTACLYVGIRHERVRRATQPVSRPSLPLHTTKRDGEKERKGGKKPSTELLQRRARRLPASLFHCVLQAH